MEPATKVVAPHGWRQPRGPEPRKRRRVNMVESYIKQVNLLKLGIIL
jgi:hypothetical protein